MKRVLVIAVTALALACMATASAGGAGSASDPLVSLSYLNGEFTKNIKDAAAAEINKALGASYDAALARLGGQGVDSGGFSFAKSFLKLNLGAGGSVTLITGSSFVPLSGTVSLTVSSGCVINVSTGSEMRSGAVLTANQRYFCAENTRAVFTAAGSASGQIDGYYLVSGTVTENKGVFSDVKATDWFFPAVDFVYKNGLFTGTSDDLFSPNDAMTRGMFVTVLHRLDGKPASGSKSVFSDVRDPSQYYYDAVMWASANGIVSGYDNGSFLPGNPITREQMAVIMYRYAQLKGVGVTADSGAYDGFSDTGKVSSFAVDALKWATAKGIINGSDGFLNPLGTATRAQVAQIVLNFSENT